MQEYQIIGLDIGRGYVKAYSEYNVEVLQCLFKSVVGLSRNIDFKSFNDPIYLRVDDQTRTDEYFAGLLAEIEGHNTTQNIKDDKTTLTAERLLYAALSKVALCDNVKIMLGVPNKMFNKKTSQMVKKNYKGKQVTIKDKITNTNKKINILDIDIFREGDAALLYYVNKNGVSTNDVGMVTIGFRTTEFSYYDKNLMYIDLKSDTVENGNKDVLEFIQKTLKDRLISKTLPEIDTSDRYDDLKSIGYMNLAESTEQAIEKLWQNEKEMDIFIAGGTALNMDFDNYKVVDDAQMITAKGLWMVGMNRL